MRLTAVPKRLGMTLCLVAAAGAAVADTSRWTHHGPPGGDVWSLAVDPTSPSTVYAGTRYGGLWKSVDGGGAWTAIDQGLPERTGLWPMSIVVDPRSPSTLYVGFFDSGVWKSTDGGGKWASASVGLDDLDIRRLTIDPESPSTLYALSGSRLVKSVDGAAGWQELKRSVAAFALDPKRPSTLYAVFDNLAFRSTDGGSTWVQTGPFRFRLGVGILAVDPSTPSTLYAASRVEGVLKSVDGGATWTPANEGLTSFDVVALAIDPQAPSRLYAATVDRRLFRSTDGAAHWEAASEGLPARAAVWAVAIDPVVSTTLYAGTEGGGVLRSADGGDTWTAVNRGLSASVVLSLTVDPSSSTLYAGTQGAGAFSSTDAGATWTEISQGLEVPSVQALAVDPRTPSTLYAGTAGGGVFKSTDGGAGWTAINEGLTRGFVQALAIDPQTPSTLYAGSGVEVWKSDDGGATWRALATGDARASTLAIHPDDPEIVYAASPTRGVLRSTDGGETWSVHNSGIRARRVLTLAIDPQAPSTLYVGAYNGTSGIYKSKDGGESWQLLSRRVIPRALAVDPVEPSTLYAAGFMDVPLHDGGVLRSRDGGRTWTDLGTGLGNRDVTGVAVDARTPTRVYAGTSGGGVFDIELARAQTALELRGGRFRVEVEWRDFQGATGSGAVAEAFPPGHTVPLRSSDSTVVEFFGPGNWEVLAKVLDGRSINDHSWVYLAAATDVGFTTTITDTLCGTVRTYVQASGAAARAVTDIEAFPECARPEPRSCRTGEGFLCLGRFDRFEVRFEWSDFSGHSGFGRQVRIPSAGTARSDDSGIFHFFTEDNWELLVKVLDGCAINDRFWVFGAATTNVEYTLRVTDTTTGIEKTYRNPLGVASAAITDTQAFATCEAD